MPIILIAHHIESERQLIVNFLNGLGYHAFGFQNGAEIITYCQQTAMPSLIFLEGNLTNFAACRTIRNHAWGKRIPLIVIVDNLAQDSEIEDAFVAGADDFLGKPLNWVVIRQRVRILLERFQAEQAQQEMERRFRSVFDTAVDVIIIIDSDGIIQSINHATSRMFGYAESELIGNKINILMPEPWASEHDKYLHNYLQTGQSRIIGIGREVICRHHDGHTFPMSLAVSQLPASAHKKTLFTGILHDISKRIAIETDLRHQKNKMQEERHVIEYILSRMHQAAPFEKNGLRVLNQPVEKTSGDLLLSAARPNGARHIFLGDFTGHGLSAALVGPLVTDIFYAMTKRGFAPDQILMEINQKLYEKLPRSLFLTGCFVEWDIVHQHVFIWNGGFPEVKIMRAGKILTRVFSHTLSLGILPPQHFDSSGVIMKLAPGDHIILFTDGITETQSASGEMFGDARLEALLEKILNEDISLTEISATLADFRCNAPQEDDITLAIIS